MITLHFSFNFLVLICCLSLIYSEILMVTSIFRHGNRHSLINLFPNRTVFGNGDLTVEGFKEAFLKGQEFKRKFIGFVPSKITKLKHIKKYVKTFSSDKSRTITTLISRLKGIFEDVNTQAIDNISKMNITEARQLMEKQFNTQFPDLMFNSVVKCSQKFQNSLLLLDQFALQVLNLSQIIKFNEDAFSIFLNDTLYPPNTQPFMKFFFLADYLERNEENHIQLTENELKLKEILTGYNSLLLQSLSKDKVLTTLLVSKLWSQIIQEFDDMIEYPELTKTRLVLFSAHDMNLHAILSSLNIIITDQYAFEFNDEINFVLHKINHIFYIGVLYNNIEVDLDFCRDKQGRLCKYELFKEFLFPFIQIPHDSLVDLCTEKITDFQKFSYKDIQFNDDL